MSKKLNETSGYKIAGLTADLMNKLRDEIIEVADFERFLTVSARDRKMMFVLLDSEPVLKRISGDAGLKIHACQGKRKIDDLHVVYKKNESAYTVKTKSATEEIVVDIYESVKDATYMQMFGGLSQDLNKMVLTEEQIMDFITRHESWLREAGGEGTTLFLSERDKKPVVVSICLYNDESYDAYAQLYHDKTKQPAEWKDRLIVPRITLN